MPDIEDMISVCAGLVAVDGESNVIRLAHYTSQEYFERILEAWNPKAQEEMASTCLTYLSFQNFYTSHCHNDEDFKHMIIRNLFLDHAARSWANHALTVQQKIEKLALPFLRDMNLVSCSTQVMSVSQHQYQGYTQDIPIYVTGVHFTAGFGMEYLLQELTHGNGYHTYVNAPDSYDRTPLPWAAASGHEAVVKLLVERDDVEVDSQYLHNRTPLSRAAASGE